jgi:hypothetical protein
MVKTWTLKLNNYVRLDMEQLEIDYGSDERDEEEAYYYHVIYDFCKLIMDYGSERVLKDLENTQRSLDINKGA